MSATKTRPKVETPEYAAMLARMIRGYGRRVGEGDEVDLAEMLDMAKTLSDATTNAVQLMREDGISWSYIALGAGVSRQAAWKRWGP
jgi:uncharacterized protein with von Willebrand factor type A (vWA) domain